MVINDIYQVSLYPNDDRFKTIAILDTVIENMRISFDFVPETLQIM